MYKRVISLLAIILAIILPFQSIVYAGNYSSEKQLQSKKSVQSTITSDRLLLETQSGRYITALETPDPTPTPRPDPPKTPAGLALTASMNSMSLTWNSASGAEGYEVEMDGKIITSTSSNSYLSDRLNPGSCHSFRVRATNSGGTSSWSNTISKYTFANIPLGKISDVYKNTVLVSWDANENEKGTFYKVGVFDEADNFIKENDWTTELTDTIEGLNYSSSYFIKIMAKNGDGIETKWNPFAFVSTLLSTQSTGETTQKGFGYYNFKTQLCVNDPVNIVTGNYYVTDEDLTISDIGPDLSIKRYYNSIDSRSGILGKSWRLNYESNLTVDFNSGAVDVTYLDGHVIRFMSKAGTNEYITSDGVFDVLNKDINGSYVLTLRSKERYVYNSSGKLISISDKNNNSITFEYDNLGQIKTINGQSGKKVNFLFESGKLKSVIDSASRKVSYTYDNNGNLHSVEGTCGGIKKYTYDQHGLTSITDENDRKYIENEYDNYNRVIKQYDENKNEIRYSYDDISMETTCYRVTANKTERYKFNDRLFISRITYDDSTYDEYTFDQSGNRDSVRDRNGNTTHYTYDEKGNLKTKTSPAPYFYVTSYTYDDDNNLLDISTQGGAQTKYEYDANGNIKKTITKLDEVTSSILMYEYDTLGRVISITDAENGITKFEYETTSKPTKIIDPENNIITYTYDSLNRIKTETTIYGTTTYEYNGKDKVEKIIDPANNITRYKYDSLGNLLKLIKPEQYNSSTDDGLGSSFYYDANDRPISRSNELGHISAVKYDQEGNKIKQINPNFYDSNLKDGVGTGYIYDGSNRLIKIINPSGKKSRIKYDAVGNIIKIIDANNYKEDIDDGLGIEYKYDEMNRLVSVKDTQGNVVKKFVYNSDNKVIKEIDAKGYLNEIDDVIRYGIEKKYNLAGWLIEKKVPLKIENNTIYYQITRYSYNKNGKIIEEKISPEYVSNNSEPSAWNSIIYSYYKNGRVKTISDTVGAFVEYSYDAMGNTTMEKNKINENTFSTIRYEYNYLGKIHKIIREIDSDDLIGNNTGNVLAESIIDYDKNGNVISTIRPEGYKSTFEYDAAGRLIAKNEEVSEDQILVNRTTVSVDTQAAALYPGQQHEYKVEIQPDTTVKGVNLQIEYDPRICEYIGASQELSGVVIDGRTLGKIKVVASNTELKGNTVLGILNLKMKEGVSGKGYVNINSLSTYTDSQGNVKTFAEGTGRIIAPKTLDMNLDGKVRTDDFTLTAKKQGINSRDLTYEEKFDVNGNGIIDVPDLDYIKDYLFKHSNETYLNKIDEAKVSERFTNSVYSDINKTVIRRTTYEYDKAGNLIKETDCNGKSTSYVYDELNRIISVTDKLNNTSRVFYDEVGNVLKQVLPENYNKVTDIGEGTTYSYDSMNRLVEVRDIYNNVVRKNVYDIKGLIIKQIDALGYVSGANDSVRYGIEFTYDIGDRLQTITTPESRKKGLISTKYKYDPMGNVISFTDGELNTTSYERDMWGKTKKVTDPYGINTSYSYDYAGNLISVTDGNNNITYYRYNSINKLAELVDPLGQKILYKYDREGRIRQEKDRNGQIILYSFNVDNNITSREITGKNEWEKYLYYKDGNLLAAINKSTVDVFQYNANGYLSNENRNGKQALSYEYDKNGNITRTTDVTGQSTGYTLDKLGRIKSVIDGTNEIVSYNYNVDNTLSGVNYTNGIKANYVYDMDKNIISLSHKNQNNEAINSFEYTYDNNGNTKSKTENGTLTTYVYDKLNRLLAAGSESFTYDNIGNRKTWSTGKETIAYNYDKRNRLTEQTSSTKGTTVFTYDNNGNQLTASNGTSYTYDGFNRLKTAVMPDGNWISNEYDALGLRAATIENGVRHGYTFDRGTVITEDNSKNSFVSRNIIGIGLVANKDDMGELNYYLKNSHGDIVNLVNSKGEVLNSYKYDAFGNITSYSEKVLNRFKYSGEQLDNTTGQYYLRARFYNPTIGRFTTEDTYRGSIIEPMSLNLYSYCENSPINFVDSSGHWKESDKYLSLDKQLLITNLTNIYNAIEGTNMEEIKETIGEIADVVRDPLTDIFDINSKIGNGFEGKFKLLGIGFEVGVKKYYEELLEDFPRITTEFSAHFEITNKIFIGAEAKASQNAMNGNTISGSQSGFLGVKIGDLKLGWGDIPNSGKMIAETSIGGWTPFIGGEFTIEMDLKKLAGYIINFFVSGETETVYESVFKEDHSVQEIKLKCKS